jgi:hypothetical protein
MRRKNIWQMLSILGLIGVVTYTIHVVCLVESCGKDIATLTKPLASLQGAEPRVQISSGYLHPSMVLLIVFSISVLMNFIAIKVKRLAIIGAILLIIIESTSFIGYNLFPLEIAGSLTSFQNIMHLVVTGIVVISTIGSSFCIGIGLTKTKEYRKVGIFIFVCAIIITISGGFRFNFIRITVAPCMLNFTPCGPFI